MSRTKPAAGCSAGAGSQRETAAVGWSWYELAFLLPSCGHGPATQAQMIFQHKYTQTHIIP
jgi:hypothetical protein